MKIDLTKFQLSEPDTQKIIGGGGQCHTFRKTYHGECGEWWEDDKDSCGTASISNT